MMEHGTITSVTYRDGVPVCAVQLQNRVDNEDETIPVARRHHGMYLVPEVGQQVQILHLDDQRWIVGVMEKNGEGEHPDLGPGELAIQLDSDTYVRFEEGSGDDYNLSLKASGDVDIQATGDVYVNGEKYSQHVHNYEDELSDGSTTTKTTDPVS